MKTAIIITLWAAAILFICLFNHGAHRNDPIEHEN